jgi:hypothetical protein
MDDFTKRTARECEGSEGLPVGVQIVGMAARLCRESRFINDDAQNDVLQRARSATSSRCVS